MKHQEIVPPIIRCWCRILEDSAVCLEDIITHHITVALTCTHKSAFHKRCINRWLEERFACPICRTRGKLYYFPQFLQNDIIETSPVFNKDSTINIVVMQTCKELFYSRQRVDNYTKIKKIQFKVKFIIYCNCIKTWCLPYIICQYTSAI